MKKKVLATLMAVSMVLSLAACGGSGDSDKAKDSSAKSDEAGAADTPEESGDGESNSDAKRIVFCKSYANIDENNQRAENALQAIIEEINGQGEYYVEYYMTDSQSQVDKQITDVESLLQYNPDIMLISAVDTEGSLPAFQQAKEQGVITIDDRGAVDEAIDINYYGSNEGAIAERIKQSLRDYLDANPDLTLNVGLIYGLASQIEQLKRCDCIYELAEEEEYKDRINILAHQYCDWSTDRATSTVEDWMIRYPEMNCIITASDDMGLGACNALTAAGKKDIYVGGVDGTQIGVQLCEDGTQNYVTVAMNQEAMMENLFYDVIIPAIDEGFTGDYYADESCFDTVTRDNVSEYTVK